jgi:hypothetical protein
MQAKKHPNHPQYPAIGRTVSRRAGLNLRASWIGIAMAACVLHGLAAITISHAANEQDQRPGGNLLDQVEPQDAPALRPRPDVIKPERTVLADHHRTDVIQVKFRDGLTVRVRDGRLTDFGTGSLNGAHGLLNEIGANRWTRMVHGVSEELLDEMRQTAQQNLSEVIADMNLYFFVDVPPGRDAAELIDRFNALESVELAEPVDIPAPPPGMFTAMPPDYMPQQGYLDPAPGGVDVKYAWEKLHVDGASTPIADVEYGFNANHQDLPVVDVLNGPPTPGLPAGFIDHGTAVLGIIASIDNGWGTTGICHGDLFGPDIAFAYTSVGGEWNVANAISTAAAHLKQHGYGFLLVEQQVAGPCFGQQNQPGPCFHAGPGGGAQYGMVPVEWIIANYNAIRMAVGNNITVIVPAGNGAQNLDAQIYRQGNGGHHPFLPNRDSGSIIVGAGSAGGRVRLAFSNYGQRVNVQAWGENIPTTGLGTLYNAKGPDLAYGMFGGTSGASAIITGTAALLHDATRDPLMPPIEPRILRALLMETGTPQAGPAENIGPLPNLRAAGAAGGARPECPSRWNDVLGRPGFNGSVNALAVYQNQLVAGGSFTRWGDTIVERIARWDGNNWQPLGTGIDTDFGNAFVGALTVHDGKLVVGGRFSLAGGNAAANVARWDGTNWQPLGNGLNGIVLALAVYNGQLFAGGKFSMSGSTAVSNIARWDGTAWQPLGAGVNGSVQAMTVYDGKLIVGGGFTSPASRIAAWDGNAWSALGQGMTGGNLAAVIALAVHDGHLIAGGRFDRAGGNGGVNNIARWNGANWSALGGGVGFFPGMLPPPGTIGPTVISLAVHNDGEGEALFVGGNFSVAGGRPARRIAKWRNGTWSNVGVGVGPSLDQDPRKSRVSAMVSFNAGFGKALHIGGDFINAGGLGVGNMAAWTAPKAIADLNHDGQVNVADLLILLDAWGLCPLEGPPVCVGDLNCDDRVNVSDLLILFDNWGPVTP